MKGLGEIDNGEDSGIGYEVDSVTWLAKVGAIKEVVSIAVENLFVCDKGGTNRVEVSKIMEVSTTSLEDRKLRTVDRGCKNVV